ncbi:MAG: ribosomal subunit interface protein [Planctomycetota bacterium]|jgi:ribosomal subunit interface protein
MKTEVSIIHHDYPSRIRDHVATKLQDLNKFFGRTVSVRALLQQERDEHHAELVANVGNGIVLVVEGKANSIHAALDEALARMAKVLKRHKAKRTIERRRPRAK